MKLLNESWEILSYDTSMTNELLFQEISNIRCNAIKDFQIYFRVKDPGQIKITIFILRLGKLIDKI